MLTKPTEGPDFLCVGMLKTGTRWLFDQLQYHPDFWMPPIKELHYLERNRSRGRNAAEALQKRRTQSADRDYDERDITFLREMASQSGPLDMQRYASLFRQKGDKLTGDITPHYCMLDDDRIAEITGYLPGLRILLLVRDPVSRAWSQISQAGRRDMVTPEMLKDPDEFRSRLANWKKLDRLSATTQAAKRWMSHVDGSRFKYVFTDDIAEQPEATRRDIIEYLGADPQKPSGEIPAGHNPKSRSTKLVLTDEIKAVLIDHLKDEIKASAALFGGHAVKWAASYGF